MTATGLQVVTILVGLALAYAGHKVFVYALTVTAFALGGAAGFFLSESGLVFGGGSVGLALAVIVCGTIAVAIAWLYIYIVLVVPGFVLGAVAALVVVGPYVPEDFLWMATLAGGIAGALVMLAVFDAIVILTTAYVGASLVAVALRAGSVVATIGQIIDVQSIGQGVIVAPWNTDLVFLLVFVTGLLVQVGVRYFDCQPVRTVRRALPSSVPGGTAADESHETDD